jgi:DNA topoisomerase-1
VRKSRKIINVIVTTEDKKERIQLIFVSDSDKGINRKKKGKEYFYYFDNKLIRNKAIIDRINKLVIPPAWKDVWICEKDNGHLQATGIDFRGRKQYRYHSAWNMMRNEKKFERLYDFGKVIPELRLKIEKDINKKELSQGKVIATLISLMERTYIRIGNSIYEKENGSYGLTTLKDNHVTIDGSKLKLSFKGKKGIHHSISLKNKKLARIIKQCRDIPGKELFQYYDEDGNIHSIDSGKVNNYIKEITNADFTAKDFRTWAGTLHVLRAFKEIGQGKNDSVIKKNIVQALDYVSLKLGNTRTVCKKYYVHPLILSLYENNCLQPYLDELDTIEKNDGKTTLTCEEKVLMNILKSAKTIANKRVA